MTCGLLANHRSWLEHDGNGFVFVGWLWQSMVLSRSYDDLKSLLPIDFGMAMMADGRV
ncbi:hypothetical protein HanHA300_Chr04g0133251 [Helianthus annuus]|nr:hypothetical protein HanHA300_Chr04g0133251 [Helianthus annuus]KAJ0757396.1 hypothetical protein HanLR1_Chr04g0138251 [Helianthus annuus]KAJ0761097.1 hypothetical protein HanOQP8_Chr04g0145801 [Helianthus annuus]